MIYIFIQNIMNLHDNLSLENLEKFKSITFLRLLNKEAKQRGSVCKRDRL